MGEEGEKNSYSARMREVRRRKILENSENRLKRITGDIDVLPKISYVESSLPPSSPNNHVTDSNISSRVAEDFDSDFLHLTRSFFNESSPNTQDNQPAKRKLYSQQKLTFTLIPLLVFVLLKSNLKFLVYESVWCPFVVTEITFLLYHGIVMEIPPVISHSLTFFTGIRPQIIHYVLKIYCLLSDIITNLSIYFFSFIIISKSWDTILIIYEYYGNDWETK